INNSIDEVENEDSVSNLIATNAVLKTENSFSNDVVVNESNIIKKDDQHASVSLSDNNLIEQSDSIKTIIDLNLTEDSENLVKHIGSGIDQESETNQDKEISRDSIIKKKPPDTTEHITIHFDNSELDNSDIVNNPNDFSNSKNENVTSDLTSFNQDLTEKRDLSNIESTSQNLFAEEFVDHSIITHRSNPVETKRANDLILENQVAQAISTDENGFNPDNLIVQNNFEYDESSEKTVLTEKVILNSAVIMSTVDVSAMKIKSNGKYVETDIASRTDAILVNFKLSKNSFQSSGYKEVYIVIQNPNGKVINEKGKFTLKNGNEVPYTDKTTTYYEKRNLAVSIFSDRFIQKIVKGTYIVKIYIEGYLIGETFLILEGY
ncbi:MAG: hypothetical protein WBM92_08145, partial [Aureibaculum sp.]